MKIYQLFPVLFLSFFVISCSKTNHHDFVISNVNIIDVRTGEVLPNNSVAIDSDTISAIYKKAVRFSDSTSIIDGTDKYLIPGLWDMHVHYNMMHEDYNPLLIANGVTGVREMWGSMTVVNDIRNKTRSGNIIAPDIFTAGNIIDGPPGYWPGSAVVRTTEEAHEVVKQQINEGVDFIKVYSFLSEECFMAIADAANQQQITFAGHIPDGMSIYQAIDAGMYCSEHLDGILMACSSKGDSLIKLHYREWKHHLAETFSEEKFNSLCSVLAESNMWLCPTLTVNRSIGYLNDTNFRNDSRLDYLPEFYRSWWNPENDFRFANATDEKFNIQRDRYYLVQSLIGEMSNRGVKFIAGTDFPNPYCFPGFSLHDELALLVDGGMTELDALRAATINGAIFMGKENEFGTVEEGKLASLVLLNDNPLENINNTKSIEAVILRGEVFDRIELDEMLEQVKTDVAKILYSAWLRSKIESDGIRTAIDSLEIMIETGSDKYLLRESDVNSLGYEYLGLGKTQEAIALFKKNTELFPVSFNVYDSYAEALMADGQYDLAIENFNKLLEFDAQNSKAMMMLDSIASLKKDL